MLGCTTWDPYRCTIHCPLAVGAMYQQAGADDYTLSEGEGGGRYRRSYAACD